MSPAPHAPLFYYDLGSPYAWLAAERIGAGLLPVAPHWQPILLGGLFKRLGSASWARSPARADGIAEVERRAARYGLPPVRWPEPWPGDGLLAMRVATWATGRGAGEAFARAAFRRAFVVGDDLSTPDAVRRAAAAAGLDPDVALAGAATEAVKRALRDATDRAADLGVHGVPTLLVGARTFFGDDHLEPAAAALAGSR
jgi:2-hydroxychromene-2-carboxylate isomerase